jgi:hypothetical protein
MIRETLLDLIERPKLIVPLGRGGRGKSFLLRWLIERAQALGRDVIVADMDRTNASLAAFFDGVVSPPSADDRDVMEFLTAFLERQIEGRFTATLDFGGGDLILKNIARENQLVKFLDQHGIMPVAIHMIGPDRDDLSYLQSVEADEIFAPPATILVLNESLCPPHRTPLSYFESTIRRDPIFVKAIERGARPVFMPRLIPAGEVDSGRLTFAAAEEGRVGQSCGIGVWKRQQIAIWRRAMEQQFAPVNEWLP